MAQLKEQAGESTAQLSSAQSEVKALQTKLSAARNTASTLENAAKAPGSAVKTPANRAQSAEVAQASQLAQLKEDLYSDLTGLIIRDVKKRETDHLYDCIQTGSNGSKYLPLIIARSNSQPFISNWPSRMSRLPTSSQPSSSTSLCWTRTGTATWLSFCRTILRWT